MTTNKATGVQNCSTLDGDSTLHITQRNGVWYFQRRIPTCSQPFYKGKRQFKKSLKTKDKRTAVMAARRLSVELDTEFARHATLTATKIETGSPSDVLERQALLQRLEHLGEIGADNYIGYQATLLDPLSGKEDRIVALDSFSASLGDFEASEDTIRNNRSLSAVQLRLERPWQVFEGTIPDNLFDEYESYTEDNKRRMFVYFVQQLKAKTPRFYQFLQGESVNLPDVSYEHPVVPTAELRSPMLSECIESYIKDKTHDELHPKTVLMYNSRLSLLLQILGDKPLSGLKRADALAVRDTVLALPANMNKKAEYRDKTIEDIIKTNPKPMSKSTANDTLGAYTSFFEWCVVNEFIERNPFTKLKVKLKSKPEDEREVFSNDDLHALFGHSNFQTARPRHPHYYWLPLLGLYTGARLNELCQLNKEDITPQGDGKWAMTFTSKGESQHLKNLSSHRTIPIHSYLVELGFIDFVQSQETRVFPELKQRRDGHQTDASRWFRRFRDSVLPKASEERKSYHSFRHSFADCLKQQGLPKSPVAALMGHSEANETYGRYGKAYVMETLEPVIEQLKYDINVKPWTNLGS